MATDPTIAKIDRFYDRLDGYVDALAHLFGRHKQTEDRQRARRARQADVSNVRRPPWRIEEIIDGTSGKVLYAVTDGAAARTECTTRQFAEKIKCALEAA